jgi:transcriptional regulator of heat shock response
MHERQKTILSAVISEYVRTAEPVSSSHVAENCNLGVSPATIRNDMAALEELGYLRQPHTSSGRVPTEEGYRHYLETLRTGTRTRDINRTLREAITTSSDPHAVMLEIARALVALSGETALMSLDSDWNRTAGISNLFQKPDFKDVETLRSLSTTVDRFDQVMKDVFHEVEKDVQVWIGTENPFGAQVATIMVKYTLPNGVTGMLGLVGPMRMDYQKNIHLLNDVRRLLEG